MRSDRAPLLTGCAAHNDCFTCPFDDCIVVSTYSANLGHPAVNKPAFNEHMRRWTKQKAAELFDKKCEHAAWMYSTGYKTGAIAAFLGVKTYTTAKTRVSDGYRLTERPSQRFASNLPTSGALKRPPCDHYPDPMDNQPPFGCLACLAGDS